MKASRKKIEQARPQVENFSMPLADWRWALISMLVMALAGLQFYPAYVLLLIVLVVSYRRYPYDFLILIMYFCGGFAMLPKDIFVLPLHDIGLLLGIGCFLLYRKRGPLAKISIAMLLYFAAIVLIARTSDESLRIQFRVFRLYFSIIFLFVPLVSFAGRDFDIKLFFRKTILYSIIIGVFYIIDGFILQGWILVPAAWNGDNVSTIFRPICAPFSTYFPRKYPSGLYIYTLALFPLAYYYRLSIKYWVTIGLSLIATRTLTFIASLVATFIIYKGRGVQLLKISGIAIVSIWALYYIDAHTGSFMRVQSTIDQFTSLENLADDEELAQFGSERMAQILPKWQLMSDLNRELLGLGFLHPTLTTNPKYIINNDLYVNLDMSEEVAGYVEETHVETILYMGFLGLAIQIAFYLYIYFVIRKLPYSAFYLCTLIAANLAGIGGYEGFTSVHGQYLLGMSLAAVLLVNRKLIAETLAARDDAKKQKRRRL